jgi:hypothetical protein
MPQTAPELELVDPVVPEELAIPEEPVALEEFVIPEEPSAPEEVVSAEVAPLPLLLPPAPKWTPGDMQALPRRVAPTAGSAHRADSTRRISHRYHDPEAAWER